MTHRWCLQDRASVPTHLPSDLAPSISFWASLEGGALAQYELQAKWIARVLSERASLPSRQKMHAHIQAFYRELELNNVPKRCALLCRAITDTCAKDVLQQLVCLPKLCTISTML